LAAGILIHVAEFLEHVGENFYNSAIFFSGIPRPGDSDDDDDDSV